MGRKQTRRRGKKRVKGGGWPTWLGGTDATPGDQSPSLFDKFKSLFNKPPSTPPSTPPPPTPPSTPPSTSGGRRTRHRRKNRNK